MTKFPRVESSSSVATDDRVSAIDFVNRVNWFFETWDVDAMVDAFLPNGVAFHFHGEIHGRDEMRHFFIEDYPYLIPGVCRHATNHIVDADGEGVAVRYQNLLVRYAPVQVAPELGTGKVLESHDELPGLWIYSPMLDRLRRVGGEWKIFERYVGGSMVNKRLDPSERGANELARYMPNRRSANESA